MKQNKYKDDEIDRYVCISLCTWNNRNSALLCFGKKTRILALVEAIETNLPHGDRSISRKNFTRGISIFHFQVPFSTGNSGFGEVLNRWDV